MHRHPKLSAWVREEDGSYKAEIDGISMHVTWRPESADRRRGFLWHIEGAGDFSEHADEVIEEIELAMVEAEERAAQHASGGSGDAAH